MAAAPLSAQVVDSIRRSIVAGEYRPGERLVEDRLAQDLGVSRVPIREALRVLGSEGLVTIAPRRGATVTGVSREEASEMVEVRATLEGLNARLAARRRQPAILDALREVLQQGNRAADAGDAAALTPLNSRFHDLLGQAGSNKVLGDLMRTLRERTAVIFAPAAGEATRATWDEHAAILRAVIAGDQDLAELLATRHVLRAGDAASTLSA
jgi:DNA-binding GntR family transcriptional regulator